MVVGCGGVEELIRGPFYFLCSKLDFSVFFPDDAWIDEGAVLEEESGALIDGRQADEQQ